MAKFSMKKGGKEVGHAGVYAKPHTMTGEVISEKNALKAEPGPESVNKLRVSIGALATRPAPEAKTSGIKIRGTGCATKGTTARGPMA